MVCPNCNKSGNVFRRIFVKRSYGENRYCIFCNAEVTVDYQWGKVMILGLVVLIALIIVQFLMQYYGWPGMNGGVAGGLAAAVIAIFIRRPPFVEITLIRRPGKNRKKK